MEDNTWPSEWLSTSAGRACPSCGAPSGRPIMWGLPGYEIFRAIDAGEIDVAFGGCALPGDGQTHECRACRARFGGSDVTASGAWPWSW